MGNFIVYLNYIRAIPAIAVYRFLLDRTCVNRDISRNVGEKSRISKKSWAFQLVWLLVNKKVFRNIFYYRVACKSKTAASVLNLFFTKQHDCEISGRIGPGLAIWHGYGTVISCNEIGENFSAWQGVTVGRNPKQGQKVDKPTIGDNCSVFTNAVVAGNIRIGSNVKIGAGSVCMKDVPDDCVVLGNPCRIRGNSQ